MYKAEVEYFRFCFLYLGMKQAILHLLAVLLPIAALAQSDCNSQRYQDTIYHTIKVTKDIKFGTATPYGLLAQPQDLYMDIYEPAGDTQTRRPLMIFQFGGGFLIGWRSQPPIPQYCEYFAKCGYVVASIDYRIGFDVLSSGSAERAVIRAVQDQRAAVRHLCQRANQYKIDTASIFLTGTSAGCFAGLHSTFMVESQIPASYHGIPLEPDDLGSIDSSGNNDYGNRNPRARGIINHWGAILDTLFIAPTDNVPVLSIHGTIDMGVPYEYGYPFSYPVFPNVYGSKPIHERLTNLGIPNVLVPLEGLNHEPELLTSWVNDTMTNQGRRFLWNIIKPVTSAISGDALVCFEERPVYSLTNTAGSKYCWQLSGPAQIISNTNNAIQLQFTDTGTVQLSVVELNYMGAMGDVKTYTINVLPQPDADFSVTTNEVTITLANSSHNLESYNWNFGDGNSSNSTSPTYTYTTPGTYTVMLYGGNAACIDTAYAEVKVDYCPEAQFTIQANSNNVFFYGTPTNTVSYNWNFGDGATANVSSYNVFHQYAANGTYTAILTVTNALGCSASDTVQFSIVPTGINGVDAERVLVYNQLENTLRVTISSKDVLTIYDATGKQVMQKSINAAGEKFYLGLLPNGTYIARLEKQQAYIKFGR